MPIEFLFLFCMRAVNIGPYIEFILRTDMLVSRFNCICMPIVVPTHM